MKRTVIATLICFLMAITLLPTAVAAETGNWLDQNDGIYTYTDFSWSGRGTESDPYVIVDGADLAGLAALVNGSGKLTAANGSTATATDFAGKYIKLSADIDLTGHNWTPIGNSDTNPFKGTFDGNGKTVSNMTVDISSSDISVYVGLFGYLKDGAIQSLTVSGSVTADFAANQITNDVGGVVGFNDSGTVTVCSNTSVVTVNATAGAKVYSRVGGVVGFNGKGTVTDCFNTGNVTTSGGYDTRVGGVVGVNDGSSATPTAPSSITNCYSTGDVTASDAVTAQVGGVVGNNGGFSGTAAVTNCYSTGDVTAFADIPPSAGGVAGGNFVNPDDTTATTAITNCYYLTGSASQGIAGNDATVTNVVEMPEAQMKAATGTKDGNGWEEVTIDGTNKGKVALIDALNEYVKNDQSALALLKWKQNNALNSGYPVFDTNWSDKNGDGEYLYADFSWSGRGTESDPYVIVDGADLAGLAALVNGSGKLTAANGSTATATDFAGKYIKLSADIDLTGHNWTPIGNSDANPFKGTFDGNGKTVRNMVVDIATDSEVYAGLFGYAEDAGVQNLTVSGSVTGTGVGYVYAGGVIGYSKNGTVTNCSNAGDVTAEVNGNSSYAEAGGVVSYNLDGTISNCSNAGTVRSEGTGTDSSVSAGGVAGYSIKGTITNSFNTGAVSVIGKKNVFAGGVVSSNATQSGIGTVANCYSTGEVTATATDSSNTNVGGVVGRNSTNSSDVAIVTNCYYLASTATKCVGDNIGTVTNCDSFDNANDTVNNDGDTATAEVSLVDALNGWVNLQNNTTLYKWTVDGGYPVFGELFRKPTVTLEASAGITGFATSADGTDGSWTNYADPVTVDYGSSLQIKAVLAEGYDFEKWATGITANPYTLASITEDISYSPSVTPKEYEVTLIPNGGTIAAGNNVTQYTYNTETLLPTAEQITRTGYTFGGWYTKADFSGTPVTKITKTDIGNKTFYAKWTANTYTVSYDANGGSLSETGKTVTFDAAYGALLTPTRLGYAFKGWFTAKDGGTEVTATTKVTTAEAHTLYAHWTANSVNITYDANGGTVTEKGKTVIFDADYGDLATPTRFNHIFNGWFTAKDGGTEVTATTKVTTAAAHTLYAHWTEKAETPPFTDIKTSDWFYHHVVYMYNAGLMQGTDKTLFSPYNETSRGMLVAILYRLEGAPDVSGACPFNDVKAGSYYEKAIIWASANKIVYGYDKDTFGPNDDITREQLAMILFRYASYKGYDTTATADLTKFPDNKAIYSRALPAMTWAVGEGLIVGDQGNLVPKGKALRCETAAIIHRFCEKYIH